MGMGRQHEIVLRIFFAHEFCGRKLAPVRVAHNAMHQQEFLAVDFQGAGAVAVHLVIDEVDGFLRQALLRVMENGAPAVRRETGRVVVHDRLLVVSPDFRDKLVVHFADHVHNFVRAHAVIDQVAQQHELVDTAAGDFFENSLQCRHVRMDVRQQRESHSYFLRNSISAFLFSIGVVVGRPKSLRLPFFTLTSKSTGPCMPFTFSRAAARESLLSAESASR